MRIIFLFMKTTVEIDSPPRSVWSLGSICRQPRRRTHQGFDEGLQQARSAHGEERGHHSGRHQDDTHQPHLPGGWCSLCGVSDKAAQAFVNSVPSTTSPQNEKEEALTTSVWIELVTTHTHTHTHASSAEFLFQGSWILSWHIYKQRSKVKPSVFPFAAVVWLQAEMGPAAPVGSVRKHHLWAPNPLQEHLAARRHPGEQVGASTFSYEHDFKKVPIFVQSNKRNIKLSGETLVEKWTVHNKRRKGCCINVYSVLRGLLM